MKKLELNQMEKINGGVSKEEYCKTLKMIMDNNEGIDPFWYDYYQC